MKEQRIENAEISIEQRIGRRVKAMLTLRGMNQAQLAEATGMSTQTISLICQGKSDFRIGSLKAIDKALQCTLVLIPNEDLI